MIPFFKKKIIAVVLYSGQDRDWSYSTESCRSFPKLVFQRGMPDHYSQMPCRAHITGEQRDVRDKGLDCAWDFCPLYMTALNQQQLCLLMALETLLWTHSKAGRI